jgi:alpha-maltose-1-phosphate synthase
VTDGRPRILGLDNEFVSDFRTENSRNAGLYRALDAASFEVVETASPRVPAWYRRLNTAAHFLPSRDLWRRRAGLNPARFRRRSRAVAEFVESRAGSFDVILQMYCLFSPGPTHPYVMYLDSTMAILTRHYPPGAPMTRRERRRWLALERDTYHQAAHVFPMSEFVKRSLVEDYGCDPERVTVVGAGTNLRSASIEGKSYERPIALFAGLDFGRKGGAVLLDAWTRVRARVPEAELWIVGTRSQEGPDRPGVRWYGRVERDRLAELYADATTFVLPALFDPFPHVLREAMAYGLPCVVTDHGAIPEIVERDRFGLFVPPGDADALADALIAMLSDRERRERMGWDAYEHAVGNVGWDAVADRMTPHIEAAAGVRTAV